MDSFYSLDKVQDMWVCGYHHSDQSFSVLTLFVRRGEPPRLQMTSVLQIGHIHYKLCPDNGEEHLPQRDETSLTVSQATQKIGTDISRIITLLQGKFKEVQDNFFLIYGP